MKFGGKIYDTQFTTRTGEKKNYFIHNMHKLAVYVIFTQMMDKKSIKNMEIERWHKCIRNITTGRHGSNGGTET